MKIEHSEKNKKLYRDMYEREIPPYDRPATMVDFWIAYLDWLKSFLKK